MAIDAIKNELATIQSGITGVKRAYAQAPASINPADLPAMVNFTGAAVYDNVSLKKTRVERTFLMRLFVAPVSGGISGETERLCEPFFERVRAAFAPSTLDGTVSNARLTADRGVSVLPYGGGQYIGIEFELTVTEVV